MNEISRIYIILGRACNLNCSYCYQDKTFSKDDGIINPDIYSFIEKLYNKNNYLDINFFGGEPLVYFNQMREIINTLGSKYNYYCLSNGKLLDKEKIDFINKNNIQFDISWDGKNSIISRGYDVIKDKFNSLLTLKKPLEISATTNNLNKPFDFFYDETFKNFCKKFKDIYKKYPEINFTPEFSYRDKLNSIDYKTIYKQMKSIVEIALNYPDTIEAQYVYNLIKKYDYYLDKKYFGCSGNRINLFLNGDLYYCKGYFFESYANIYNYSDKIYSEYDKKFNFQLDEKCKQCDVKLFCDFFCPLKGVEEERCNRRKALFLPIIELIRSYECL